MSGYKGVVVRSLPAIVGLVILLFVGSHLSTSVYHSELTKYGEPICSIDRHVFDTATCEACGQDVMKSGVFFSPDVAMSNPYSDDYQVYFSDYYDSYEEFKSDYTNCLVNSVFALGVFVTEIGLYVFLFMNNRSKRSGLKLRGGRKQ